jgi:hypothetical protein
VDEPTGSTKSRERFWTRAARPQGEGQDGPSQSHPLRHSVVSYGRAVQDAYFPGQNCGISSGVTRDSDSRDPPCCPLRGICGPCSDRGGRVSEGLGELRPPGWRNSGVFSREIAQIGVRAHDNQKYLGVVSRCIFHERSSGAAEPTGY